MQFVDVIDVARMIEHLIVNNIYGIFPAAAPNFMSMNQYLENIEEVFNVKVRRLKLNAKFSSN